MHAMQSTQPGNREVQKKTKESFAQQRDTAVNLKKYPTTKNLHKFLKKGQRHLIY